MSLRRKIVLKIDLDIRHLFRYFWNIKIQFIANAQIKFN